jgi:ABC-2 type transport system permease protein
MMRVRGALELSRAYLLQTVRSRSALIWTLAFPQVWLLTITAFSGSFFGVAYTLVTEREQGILRRLWVTPATASTVVAANAVRSLVTVSVSLTMQGLVAWLVLDVDFGAPLLLVATVLLFGIVAFVPLGLIMGSSAKDMRSAPAIGNLIFFPMIFLSGAALPMDLLPGWLQTFGRLLPTTYLVQALDGVMVRGEGLGQQAAPLAVLLVSGVVSFGFNSLLFRWESTQPLGARRVGAAVGALALLYAIAALLT